MTVRTLEQERAAFAYEKVSSVADKEFAGNYRAYVKKAPAMIMTNGLIQTLAFFKAKGKKNKAYEHLFSHVVEWLKNMKYYDDNCNINGEEAKDSFEWLIYCATPAEVLSATEETLALLNWMRRFTEAMIEKEEEGEG